MIKAEKNFFFYAARNLQGFAKEINKNENAN